MVGTIISQPGITVSSPGVAAVTTINGRVIALGASTTLVNTVINVPVRPWLRPPQGGLSQFQAIRLFGNSQFAPSSSGAEIEMNRDAQFGRRQ